MNSEEKNKNNLNKIKDKIRNLKRLADNSAATAGEVEAALNLANKLASEYYVNLDDLKIEEEDLSKELDIEKEELHRLHNKFNLSIIMDTKIANYFDCRVIISKNKDYLKLIGSKIDRDLTVYGIDLAHNSLNRAWAIYKNSEEYETQKNHNTYSTFGDKKKAAKIVKSSFFQGFLMGVIEVVDKLVLEKEKLKTKTTGTSLICIQKENMVQDYMEKEFPCLRTKSKTTYYSVGNRNSFNSGKVEGSKIQFTSAIRQNRNSLLLK